MTLRGILRIVKEKTCLHSQYEKVYGALAAVYIVVSQVCAYAHSPDAIFLPCIARAVFICGEAVRSKNA